VSTFKVGTLLVIVRAKSGKRCAETPEICAETPEACRRTLELCGETPECVPNSCGLTHGPKGGGADIADATGDELQQLKLHLRVALARAGKRGAKKAPKAKKAKKAKKSVRKSKKPGK
jgi:hypothetical protein